MPQSQCLSSVIPFAAIERPACPKCKAHMMLVSIEPARAGVDLHAFECAVCNQILATFAAFEDPRNPRALDAGFKAICAHDSKARRHEPVGMNRWVGRRGTSSRSRCQISSVSASGWLR